MISFHVTEIINLAEFHINLYKGRNQDLNYSEDGDTWRVETIKI
jgi:hypothetical protein